MTYRATNAFRQECVAEVMLQGGLKAPLEYVDEPMSSTTFADKIGKWERKERCAYVGAWSTSL